MKKWPFLCLIVSTSLIASSDVPAFELMRSYRIDSQESRLIAALKGSPGRVCSENEEICWRAVGQYVQSMGGAAALLPADNKNHALLEKWSLAVAMEAACRRDAEWQKVGKKWAAVIPMLSKHAAGKHRNDEWWAPVDSDGLIRRWFAVAAQLEQLPGVPYSWTTAEQRARGAVVGGVTLATAEDPVCVVTLPVAPYYAAALSLRAVEKLPATSCDRVLVEYVGYRLWRGQHECLVRELLPHVGIMLKWRKDKRFLPETRVSFLPGQGKYSQTPPSSLETVIERAPTPEGGA